MKLSLQLDADLVDLYLAGKQELAVEIQTLRQARANAVAIARIEKLLTETDRLQIEVGKPELK